MHRKRAGERRQYSSARIFPIIDDTGSLVAVNRSHTPDRRLENYQLTEIDTAETAQASVNDER